MTLRSAGLQSRNFIAIHDVARAISHCLDIDRTTMGDGLYNLGGDISVRVIDMVSEIADRCESVLGYRPPIRCAEPGPAEVTLPLEYRIDKFRSTGFALAGNRIEEIDATLRFCQGAFCR
jgi:UDP-glucose 4-epimerase